MRAYLAAGLKEHKHGRLDRAKAFYRKVLSKQPGNATALNLLGVLMHQEGESERAIRMLERALRAKPSYGDALKNLGNVHLEAGNPAEAEQCYQKLIERDPLDPDAWNNLCVAFKSQRRFDEAIEAGRRAVALSPGHLGAWFNLANALKSSGHMEEAVANYRRVLGLNSAFVPAHVELCQALYRLEQIRGPSETLVKERIEAYRNWRALEPDNPVPQFMLSACMGEVETERAPDDFVRKLFDGFAHYFDQNLAALDYRVPELIRDRLLELQGQRLDVLDAGCGTGLCCSFLRPLSRTLVGVDLSGGMLKRAASRQVYDELVEAELGTYFSEHPESFDLIVAADTFVYFGNLDSVLAAAAMSLRPGGRLIFSLEHLAESSRNGVQLNSSGRYAHSQSHALVALAACALEVVSCEREVLRMESGHPVQGLIIDTFKSHKATLHSG